VGGAGLHTGGAAARVAEGGVRNPADCFRWPPTQGLHPGDEDELLGAR
jgi:hypothetical protein